MKRIIALSLVLVIALACIPFSASAVAQKCQVHNKMIAARDKLYSDKESFSVVESYDFWLYLQAEGDPTAYKDAYIQSVKEAVSGYTIGDAANCALVTLCLQKLGVDPAQFSIGDSTVNLFEIMKTKGTVISSPYLYRYIVESNCDAAFKIDCFYEMNKEYHKGEGYDYYGYSGDNCAAMGVCYTCYGTYYIESLPEEVTNACNDATEDFQTLLSTNYKTDTGYICNADWYIFENIDTTALALSFFSVGAKAEAEQTYAMLKNYEVEGEEGAYFASYDPGVYNAYGTRDALIGLIDYYNSLFVLPEHNFEAQKVPAKANALGYTYYKCACGETKKDAKGNVVKDNFTAPKGKPSGFKCAARTAAAEKFAWNKTAGVSGYQVQLLTASGKNAALKTTTANSYVFTKLVAGYNYTARVRFFIKAADGKNYYGQWTTIKSPTLPKGTSLVKVTPAKKAFTAQWNANKAVTGYQVQYITNNKIALKAVKGAGKVKLSVTGLTGSTKYIVRVRTFKTIGGKNYYSSWSAAKTVKTK